MSISTSTDGKCNCPFLNYLSPICFSGSPRAKSFISNPVPHSRHRLMVVDPSPQTIYFNLQFTKIVKTTCPKVENEILNIVHVQCSLHLLKPRTTMDNIFLSHSYIPIFLPKSLFSITLILICITLSSVTLLGNHFSFHFIALCYKRKLWNLVLFTCKWTISACQ